MSCFILPTNPFFKLAFLPRVVIGYPQCYPTPTAAPPPPTLTPTAATQPRFIRQPLPPNTTSLQQAQLTTNGGYPVPGTAAPTIDTRSLVQHQQVPHGDFRAAFQPGAAAVAAAFLGSPSYPKTSFRSTSYHRGNPTTANSPGIGKGIKRKSDELLSAGTPSPGSSIDGNGSADGETGSKADSTSSGGGCLLQPLYCKVCRVTLNAPAQAKQHYEGKNHSKKMRLYDDDEDDKDKSTGSDANGSDKPTSPSGNTSPTTTEIHPEVYCRTCGVSFNSPKQAQQHYQGKNHAKKTRASAQQEKQSASSQGTDGLNKYGSKFNCDACNIHVTSQEQLDSHLKGARHAARGRPERPLLPPIARHRWKQVAFPQLRPDKFLHHSLTPAFCQTF